MKENVVTNHRLSDGVGSVFAIWFIEHHILAKAVKEVSCDATWRQCAIQISSTEVQPIKLLKKPT